MSPVTNMTPKPAPACSSQRARGPRGARRSLGFTIIELMVSMVLGLILIGAVLGVFLNSKQTLGVNAELARMQENARFAFELMMRELRDAGSTGCGSRMTANAIRNSPQPWWADTDSGFILGFDGAQDSAFRPFATTGLATRVAGTDAIRVLRVNATDSNRAAITAHDASNRKFTVASVASFVDDDIAVVCDGVSAALFQIDTVDAVAQEIDYSGSGTANCTTDLGNIPVGCTGATARTFNVQPNLYAWAPAFWYIGRNSRGGRSLYRMGREYGGQAQEMVPDVQDMQIEYLTKNLNSDTLASDWISASTAPLSGNWVDANNHVVGARVRLTLMGDNTTQVEGNRLTRSLVAVAQFRNREF
jgi:type IV pilus assembly protein PilW